MSDHKVHIIILNYDGWAYTIECLENVLRNHNTNYQIIVVDNNSKNKSIDNIKAWAEGKLGTRINRDNPLRDLAFPSVHKPIPYVYYTANEAEKGGHPEKEKELEKLVRNNSTITTQYPLVFIQTGSNLGFAGGNNVGIRYALKQTFDYILVLNNDTVPRDNAISQMINFMENTPSVGVCGARLLYPDGSPQPSYGCFPTTLRMIVHLFPLHKLFPKRWFKNFKRLSITPSGKLKDPIKVDYPSGACLMIRRQTIEEVGLLDERFFVYYDETDWCYRMMRAGWDRYYVPTAEVFHYGGGSFQNASLERRIYSLESRLCFFVKHYSKYKIFLLCVLHILSSLYFLLYWKLKSFLTTTEDNAANKVSEDITYALTMLRKSTKQIFYSSRKTCIK